MKIQINRYILQLLLLFVSTQAVLSQKKNISKIPLTAVLTAISNQHKIGFSYLDQDVSLIAIEPPNHSIALNEKLQYLEKNTGLSFSFLDEKHVVVLKLNKIKGYVYDQENNLPIRGVIFQTNQQKTIGTSSSDGYFELSANDLKSITISCLGYDSLEIKAIDVTQDKLSSIYLIRKAETLSEIIIPNYLATGISKKTSGLFEVKPKKFGILPGLIEPDVLQTIQHIPGVNSPDETISNISVRGGSHDQNLFLWNGIRMFQTGHFFGLISAFNPSLAHTIKIYKNGSSAFYGESVSSVIDISTHQRKIEESKTIIGTNLINVDFYNKIKLSNTTAIEISGRRSFTDFITSPTYKKYYNRVFQNTIVKNLSTNNIIDYESTEDFYFYDFTAQYQKKIGRKHEIIVDLIGINNKLQLEQKSLGFQNSITKKSKLHQHNFGSSVHWYADWNTKNSTKVNFYTTIYELGSSNESIDSNQILNQENSVFDWGFRFENQYKTNSLFNFNTGYQYNSILITNIDQINSPSFERRKKDVLNSHTTVLETEYTSRKQNIVIKSGVRINYLEKFKKTILEPRLQIDYSLSKSISLELLAELKSQTTTQIIDLQGDFLGLEKRRWTLTNDGSIPIQKSQQISQAISYQNKEWLISIENFYKKVTGITTNAQGFQNQLEFLNISGSYKNFGSEFLVQRNFKRFHTWLSYTINSNHYHFDNFSPKVFPNNLQITNVVSWAGIYEWKNLKVAIGSKWHSGKFTTTPINTNLSISTPLESQIDFNEPNNKNLKDYLQFNFSARQNFQLSNNTQIQIGISVLNILNNQNILNSYFRKNNNNQTIESINTYSLERTPNISFKISF